VTVAKASPRLTTSASPGVALGRKIHDTAKLRGGHNPTGKVTFRLYGPGDSRCSKRPRFTTTRKVAGDGSYPSASFTPKSTGTYRWRARYSGDSANKLAAGACKSRGESVTLRKR
jgi:hypothetical protein